MIAFITIFDLWECPFVIDDQPDMFINEVLELWRALIGTFPSILIAQFGVFDEKA